MKRWLVVSLLVPNEFIEGISNFLMERGSTGIEELEEDLKWTRLKAYFPQDGNEKRVLGALRQYLKALQEIGSEKAFIPMESASIPELDWGKNWKKFFKPVQATSRFVVKPPWSKVRLKKGQLVIDINPGMAFGTGTHTTTKLCLKALEENLQRKGFTVLDVGTGSGILSIAAAQLGAVEVWGLDVDGVALENARENVRRNGVSNIVKIRKKKIGDIRKKFDVVVANIDFKSLRRMRRTLILHLKNQGCLILSGILEEEGKRLCQHYLDTGLFAWTNVTQEEGWACLTFKKW